MGYLFRATTQYSTPTGLSGAVDATQQPNFLGGAAPAVPGAKTGSLTTYTTTSSGTLTLDAGHGVTTGATLDVYWAGGRRYGTTVGTVATNSVPVSGGTGDNLPAAGTAVTVMVPVTYDFADVTGNSLAAVALQSAGARGFAQLRQQDGTAIGTPYEFGAGTNGPMTLFPYAGSGTNPTAGVTVGKVTFSHGSASATVMTLELYYN